ncbi:hypothetical protein L6452_02043 [Arctium lappa]|uniref:Uncharacterized protein n=1 Tax=Arctium lappa TaxID=4217 RepID=A0ACB9FIC1_ARCLA|nr:hypothetical protein L6452_02043 [Arctium lappa]
MMIGAVTKEHTGCRTKVHFVFIVWTEMRVALASKNPKEGKISGKSTSGGKGHFLNRLSVRKMEGVETTNTWTREEDSVCKLVRCNMMARASVRKASLWSVLFKLAEAGCLVLIVKLLNRLKLIRLRSEAKLVAVVGGFLSWSEGCHGCHRQVSRQQMFIVESKTKLLNQDKSTSDLMRISVKQRRLYTYAKKPEEKLQR